MRGMWLIIGVFLIVFGVVSLLGLIGIVALRIIFYIWPVFVILLGITFIGKFFKYRKSRAKARFEVKQNNETFFVTINVDTPSEYESGSEINVEQISD